MKRVLGIKKLIIVILSVSIVIFTSCKSNETRKSNIEVSVVLQFIEGFKNPYEINISLLNKYEYQKNIYYYQLSWNHTDYLEDINLTTDTYTLLLRVDTNNMRVQRYFFQDLHTYYPEIEKIWSELNKKNKFRVFSPLEIENILSLSLKFYEHLNEQ